jgi:hypothetical protein
LEQDQLDHTPFLVFVVLGDTVNVEICVSARALVTSYKGDTSVMVQWPGKFRSDYFQMTVNDVMAAMLTRGLHVPWTPMTPPKSAGPTLEDPERTGICTDCKRRTGEAEIGQPCRVPQPFTRFNYGGMRTHCRGRIVQA